MKLVYLFSGALYIIWEFKNVIFHSKRHSYPKIKTMFYTLKAVTMLSTISLQTAGAVSFTVKSAGFTYPGHPTGWLRCHNLGSKHTIFEQDYRAKLQHHRWCNFGIHFWP